MMIPDYDNDAKMAEYGRRSARYKAIKDAREMIRNYAVMIGNSNEALEVSLLRKQLNTQIDNLIDALEAGSASITTE